MNTQDTSLRPADGALALAGRLGNAAEDVFGAATVSLFLAVDGFVRCVVRTDSWIFFFLVTKPLFDLTWRWRFFQISEQGVNIQTFVGLIVLGLNCIAILSSAAWRRLPSRVLIFVAFATFSVIVSPSSWGINELLRLLAGTTFFYTAGPLLAHEARFDRFAKALLAVTTIPIVLSFLQLAGVLPYDYWDWLEAGQVGRVSGTYNTPLGLVYLFIYVFPLALYIADSRKQKPSAKWWAWLFILGASVVLAFTYHRAGYVAVVLGIVTWLYLSGRRKAIFALVIVLLVVVLMSMSFLRLLYAPLEQALTGNAGSEEFLRGRGFQWLLYMNSFLASGPLHWVFGLGGSVIEGVDSDDSTYVLSPNEPHNEFIRILHAYGILGLVLYLSVLAVLFRRSLLLLRSSDEFGRTLGKIVLAALASVMLLSMTAEPMRYPTAVWYLFALGSALFCVETKARPLVQAGQRP